MTTKADRQMRLKRWLIGIVLIGMCWGLSACGVWAGPPKDVVEQALTLRLQQTQQELQARLKTTDVSGAAFRSGNVEIKRAETVTIDNSSAYRVSGQYTLQGRYHGRRYRQRTPFELYLAPRDSDRRHWELLQPQTEATTAAGWEHIPLP